mmetsp:Transcript_7006/g.9683  ORF Transcript_7006/g.9683 Transcript_7006/m.9683 type:complete len:184 (-) Transcript_7006:64-615(-)
MSVGFNKTSQEFTNTQQQQPLGSQMALANSINVFFCSFILGTIAIDSMVDHYTWANDTQQMLKAAIPYYKIMESQPPPYQYILGIVVLSFFGYLIFTVVKHRTPLNLLTFVATLVLFYSFQKVEDGREAVLKLPDSPEAFPKLQEIAHYHFLSIISLVVGLVLQLIEVFHTGRKAALEAKKVN